MNLTTIEITLYIQSVVGRQSVSAVSQELNLYVCGKNNNICYVVHAILYGIITLSDS